MSSIPALNLARAYAADGAVGIVIEAANRRFVVASCSPAALQRLLAAWAHRVVRVVRPE